MSSAFTSKDFKIIKEIGEGAYGCAFLALDKHGQKYVIKKIDISRMSTVEKKSCVTEVALLSSLSHPFIVDYKGTFVSKDHINIVMDLCAGGDLENFILKRKEKTDYIEENLIINWLSQLLMALKHIHSNRVIHRDIKSSNIFIESDGRLRVGDFGISKMLDHTNAKAKTFIGTPFYLSPELCRGEAYSKPSDIWSLGCVLYEMAALHTPFSNATNIPQLMKKITEDPIPNIPSIYSKQLQNITCSMLQRDPSKRPTVSDILALPRIQNAISDMIDQLESISEKKSFNSQSSLLMSTSSLSLLPSSAEKAEKNDENGKKKHDKFNDFLLSTLSGNKMPSSTAGRH